MSFTQTWRAEDVSRRASHKLNTWRDSASRSESRLLQERGQIFRNVARATRVPKVLRLLARILERRGRYDAAARHLANAAAFDDAGQRGHWQLAKFLLRRQRADVSPETAATIRTQLLLTLRQASRSTDPQIRLNASVCLARVLHHVGCYRESLAVAEGVLHVEPRELSALRAKADSLLAIGDFAQACLLYRWLLGQVGERGRLARILP